MRQAFVQALLGIAAEDPRVLLLTGDLGYHALEPFRDAFPRRFLNVGVAEQNLIAVATGLAEAGFKPYCYSIAPFAALRPYEFIRNGPISHRLPVRIVGMGGGFDYATNGLTHYGIDDLGVLRVQPGIAVIAPADGRQAAAALRATAELPGPVYYRLGKDDALSVPGLDGRFSLGEPEHLREGDETLFVTTGAMAAEAVAAAEELGRRGVGAGVAVVSSLNPVNRRSLARILAGYDQAISVEAHYLNGGVGSLAAELIAEEGLGVRLRRLGVRETPDGIIGGIAFLRARHGLDRSGLVQAALAGAGVAA